MATIRAEDAIEYKEVIGNVRHLQIISIGARAPLNVNGGAADGNRRTAESQKLCNLGGRGGRIGGIKVGYVNWRLDSSTIISGANSIFIGASMLAPFTGPAQKYTFNGNDFLLVKRGGLVISDQEMYMDLEPNEQILIRSGAQTTDAAHTIVGGGLNGSLSFDLSRSHTDLIAPADEASDCSGRVHNNGSMGGGYSPTDGINSLFPFTPALVLGYSERPQPAVFLIGDSNAYGTKDAANGDGQGCIGYIERGFRASASGVTPLLPWVRPGMTLSIYTSTTTGQLFYPLIYATHFLQQLSGNSIGGGLTLAQMKAATVIAWKAAKSRGVKTIQLSSLPRVNAANDAVIDGWEVGGLRDQYNAWAQSVVGQKINATTGDLDAAGDVYLDIYWDVLDVLQDPATNLFLSGAYVDADGIHLSPTGASVAAIRIASLANALTIY